MSEPAHPDLRIPFLTRVFRVFLPPPKLEQDKRPLSAGQKKVLGLTAAGVGILLLGSGIAYYMYSAPERAEAEFQAGMVLMRPGTYPQAIEKFQSAAGIWDRHSRAYLQKGVAEVSLGQLDAALEDFERAAAVDPTLADAYTARGAIYRDRGDVRRAIEAFSKSLAVRPTMDGYFQRGQLFFKQGDLQKAAADYEAAISIDTRAPYLYRARGEVRRLMGDQTGYEADRDFAHSIEFKR